MSKVLTHQQARGVYDRIGALQDSQAFYEDRVVEILLRHGEFESARDVFEFGSGTGRFARRLCDGVLPPKARYRGVDLSPTMVALARKRLEPHASRAEVAASDGEPPTGEASGACDRFVANFVLDLLSEEEIRAVVGEAHRMLRPGGLLCAASLSVGAGPVSRAVARAWSWVHARSPALVGGCRPLDLLPFFEGSERSGGAAWRVRHHERIAPFGLPCEALVAERLG